MKKLKDADPAGIHHQDIVKQDIVTVTIETNFRQGEAVVKEDVVTQTATFETNLQQGHGDGEQRAVQSVEVKEIQKSVGESSFWLRARVF